jgi:quercetin dioxygenase-like cupin family protein
MNPQAFVLTPDSYPRALDVLGVQITVLAPNSATHGYEITLQEGGEGAGPPPHSHPWDESFFVMRGRVEFGCADKIVEARAGSLVHVPAGTVHAFRFGAGGGAMIEFSGAGGAATRMFTQLAQEVPPGPPDVPKLVAILQNHGVSVAA